MEISVVTGVLTPLLGKLNTLLAEEYSYLKTLRKKIAFLQAELGAIHAFLFKMSQVAEPDEQDKHWMKEVEKLSHVIHDSINDFMRLEDDKTKRKGLKGFTKKIWNLSKQITARHRIGIQVSSLQTLIIQAGERQARYKVHYNVSKATNSRPMEHNLLETELPVCNPTEALEAVLGKLTTLLSKESKLLKTTRDKVVFLKAEIEAMHAFVLKMSRVEVPDEHDEYWMKEMQKLSQDIHDSISDFMHPVDDKPAKPASCISITATTLKDFKTRQRIRTQVDHLHALVTEVGQRHARYKVDYNISKATSSRSMEHDVLEHILDGTMEPTNLPFELLKNITKNFSEEQKIGQGGFGSVYKGTLQNGTVAVKRIFNSHTIDVKLFQHEVNNLLDVNHDNVVRFLGYCACTEEKAMRIEGEREYVYAEMRERLLCFEYICNGSLSEHITDELRGLDWNSRYQIIKQICAGLLYLHQEKHIFHMDLKPDNILLDDHMMAKITDFGLSRLDEKSQTMDANRYVTFGYCAPEYLQGGKRTFKLDVYSLGVIIIELVTGYKDILDNSNVLRRWRHRWRKSRQETPWACQELQITKCMEIGRRCQENDPFKRPFIWDIIRDIDEIESVVGQISNADESDVDEIRPYWEDDMLAIEPLKLHFPFYPNKQISCSLQLINDTGASIAFSIQSMSPMTYCIHRNKGIVPPQSSCTIDIILQPQDKAPKDMQHPGEFTVRSTKVADGVTTEEITSDMFYKVSGEVVDEVNLDVDFDVLPLLQ